MLLGAGSQPRSGRFFKGKIECFARGGDTFRVWTPSSVTSIGEDAFPAWTVIRRVPSKHRLLVVWAVAVVGAAVLVAAMAELVGGAGAMVDQCDRKLRVPATIIA